MKNICLGIFIIVCMWRPAYSQVVEEWVARYNGIGNGKDDPVAVAVDLSGNVYVTGASIRSGTSNFDYATVKYDPSGNQQWVAMLNGPGNSRDIPAGLALDRQGNIAVTGFVTIAGINTDYATVKYDPAGTEQWVTMFSGTANNFDAATAIVADSNGNFYVTGRSVFQGSLNSDYTTLKYNSAGAEILQVTYDGPAAGEDIGRALAVDPNGSIYVTGTSLGSGNSFDIGTLKYGPAGQQLWLRRYDGPGQDIDEAVAIELDAGLNVYVCGYSRATNMGNSEDITVIKYDPGADQQWVARYNGPGNNLDLASAMAVDAAGFSYVCGKATAANGFTDFVTLKYSPLGTLEWAALYDGPQGLDDIATDIALDAAGNVYVTGFVTGNNSLFDFTTIKYTPSGAEEWVVSYDDSLGLNDKAAAIAVDNSGNVYVTGSSSGTLIQNTDFVTIKYSQPTGIQRSAEIAEGFSLAQNYPNPFNPITTIAYNLIHSSHIALQVYDALGREIATLVNGQVPAGRHQVVWDGSDDSGRPVASGVYFYRLEAGVRAAQVRKMLLLR